MAVEIVMPKLGMAMVEGTVSEWNKQAGDAVSKGEIIATINSEKIEMEIGSPVDGVLLQISVPVGPGVPPGTVIGYVGYPNEKVDEKRNDAPDAHIAEAAATAVVAKTEPKPLAIPVSKRGEIKISPVARKLAESAGLNIETINGTGPQGRITKEDVEQVIANQSSSAVPDKEQISETTVSAGHNAESSEKISFTGIRKVIATRMHESLQQSAQLTLTMRVDVSKLAALQKQMIEFVQKQYETKITISDFVARAVVLSLLKHREINSALLGDQIFSYNHVHLGIAVALEKGLVVPVIRHAENRSLIEIARAIKLLAKNARDGQLSSEDMKGSTFTITNLGGYGIEFFTPVLNPPESGILGVGAVQEMPVLIDEKLQMKSVLPLSLTFDHRVLDGAPAAEFLRTVKSYLEEPFTLLL